MECYNHTTFKSSIHLNEYVNVIIMLTVITFFYSMLFNYFF